MLSIKDLITEACSVRRQMPCVGVITRFMFYSVYDDMHKILDEEVEAYCDEADNHNSIGPLQYFQLNDASTIAVGQESRPWFVSG